MRKFPTNNFYRISLVFIFSTVLFSSKAFSNPFLKETPEQTISALDEAVQKPSKKADTTKAIADLLHDEATPIKIKERAAWALGQLNATDQIPVLLKAAKHKGLLVRSAGLEALLHLRTAKALPTFIDIAKNDPVFSMRQRACIALGLLGFDKAIDPLVKLSSDPKEEIRGAALIAMAAHHSKRNDFREVVKEMKSDPSAYVQNRAEKASQIIGRKNKAVQSQLKDPDQDIRLFAALYFEANGVKTDLQSIQAALDGEPNDEVKFQLEKSIKAIKKRSAQKAKAAPKKKAPKPTTATQTTK